MAVRLALFMLTLFGKVGWADEVIRLRDARDFERVSYQECSRRYEIAAVLENPLLRPLDLCRNFLVLDVAFFRTPDLPPDSNSPVLGRRYGLRHEVFFLERQSGIIQDGEDFFVNIYLPEKKLVFTSGFGSLSPARVFELHVVLSGIPEAGPGVYLGAPLDSPSVRLLAEARLYEVADAEGVFRPENARVFQEIVIMPYPSGAVFRVEAKLTDFGLRLLQTAAERRLRLFHLIQWMVSHRFAGESGDYRASAAGTFPCMEIQSRSNLLIRFQKCPGG